MMISRFLSALIMVPLLVGQVAACLRNRCLVLLIFSPGQQRLIIQTNVKDDKVMNTNGGMYFAPLNELMTNYKQCGGDLAYR